MYFCCGKNPYIKCCSRKEKSGIAWLVAGVWQLKGITRNTVKRRSPLCSGKQDIKRILLDCLKTRNWRRKFLNEKLLSRNKDVACRKFECKWFKIIRANMYGS